MLIITWSWALIALFNWQYSYDVRHQPVDAAHINVTERGTLLSCIYPKDKPFKKGSNTFARAELRSLYEADGKTPYKFSTELLSVPNGTDYSVWQVFGDGKPLLMIRHRKNKKEMVVFDGKPKIQVIDDFPESCIVDCVKKKVTCGKYSSSGKLKCKKMYFKLGVYSQQKKPDEKMCVEYGKTNYFSLV